VALGFFYPATAETMKPLGDGFIKLIKMMIAPIIFTTVVVGIAPAGNYRSGREKGTSLISTVNEGKEPRGHARKRLMQAA